MSFSFLPLENHQRLQAHLSAPEEPHLSFHYLLSWVIGKNLIKHVRTEQNYLKAVRSPRAPGPGRKAGKSLKEGWEREEVGGGMFVVLKWKRNKKRYAGNRARICFAYNK